MLWEGTGFVKIRYAVFVKKTWNRGWVHTVFSLQNATRTPTAMRSRFQAMTVTLLLLPLAGCFVQSKKGANGDDNVAISTPLGGMTVKTDSSDVQAKLGLPLYPGAVAEKKKDNDNGSADVNMNFGPFHLRVLAMGFTSTDSPDKVRAYYKKALAQYSDVIECRHKQAIGTPARTGLGLTCDDDNHVHSGSKVNVNDDADETELKAGSQSRQHIVSFKPQDGGTKFGLVALELPHGDDDKDSSKTAN